MTHYPLFVYNYREMAVHSRIEKRDVPVRKRVYENLKAAILSGRLGPNERLTEEHLAETLGASRTPVREALYKLETEGLIRPLETRGFIVSGDSKEEMEELFELRAILEGYALYWPASARTHFPLHRMTTISQSHLALRTSPRRPAGSLRS